MEKTSAIIETGGKQYSIKVGDLITVERLPVEIGGSTIIDKILLMKADKELSVGLPYVEKAVVKATVIEHSLGKKVRAFKMRRRKKSRRTQGFRRMLSKIIIDDIDFS